MAESAIQKWYELRLWRKELQGIISRNSLEEVHTAVLSAGEKYGG
jgi:hypothetical protein